MIGIVWFRQDLRLADNAALLHACNECDVVIPVFIDDAMEESISSIGGASSAWLHRSLESLSADLSSQQSKLIFRQGEPLKVLSELINETKATHLYWNRCYEPKVRKRDEEIKTTLSKQILSKQIKVKSFKGSLLLEPWEVLKQDDTPYRVFTPYWKALVQKLILTSPYEMPSDFKPAEKWPDSLELNQLKLLPQEPIPRWDEAMMKHWKVGEDAAHDALHEFLEDGVQNYKEKRDFPAIGGTSLLSPHLHFGEISPLQVFHYSNMHKAQNPHHDHGVGHILRQVVWREFAYALLYHFPETVTDPLFEKYKGFEWRNNEEELKRWQQGNTGFPIIDAGMRELWQTGYMHNRVRMIAASFLTKNLLIHWHKGEAWFRDTLVDADIANNTMGWQWVAGSGADAAPYYRIFNPVLQSNKFDGKAEYIRRWVPELSKLDNKAIHQPSVEQAKECNYPEAMVDLKATRERALDRYSQIK
ncbi:deoxyribodipyrimidine photo-lyase [Cocleimonas sp. KMM 6892]|uniref:cryptochrome/photolyase family protein n=1 Tax=unclassified Cocleimonas TaxID=2639732 RepID=UPI002DB68369|nr:MULTISPECIES: deoxyribodipyrimidine photo-lyase [unclassified Cocleimonas]MEB8431565.1 deoxyribodipyrimidine photo-lyase [Cocleimonas sp. KMM 6892]MEC4713663.1 deoxyribodipyrimidine photo-lyase [Cocleimonas sp. KMM 6895]MEC4742994.1 deoxyribodipyrimidine photo-lyase [Cocleimonas sp. KMM 6896]